VAVALYEFATAVRAPAAPDASDDIDLGLRQRQIVELEALAVPDGLKGRRDR